MTLALYSSFTKVAFISTHSFAFCQICSLFSKKHFVFDSELGCPTLTIGEKAKKSGYMALHRWECVDTVWKYQDRIRICLNFENV